MQKLAYLLGADIMFDLYYDYVDGNANLWVWDGSLTCHIDNMSISFFVASIDRESILQYALLVA